MVYYVPEKETERVFILSASHSTRAIPPSLTSAVHSICRAPMLSPPGALDNKIGAWDTRRFGSSDDRAWWRGCDATRDRGYVHFARRCEREIFIPFPAPPRRTNIDSKFVRAWPARAKPIKRRPDNIFIRERMQNACRRCLAWRRSFLRVSSSRTLWDVLRDSVILSPGTNVAAIYIYLASMWHTNVMTANGTRSRGNDLISNGALAITRASDMVDRMQYIAW